MAKESKGYVIWDDYTDELYNAFGSRQEAEVYLEELIKEEGNYFTLLTHEEYEELLYEMEQNQ